MSRVPEVGLRGGKFYGLCCTYSIGSSQCCSSALNMAQGLSSMQTSFRIPSAFSEYMMNRLDRAADHLMRARLVQYRSKGFTALMKRSQQEIELPRVD